MRSQSMPRFARMLQEAYTQRGHEVTVWSPQARMYLCVPAGPFEKWAGYIDQYLLFPLWVKWQLLRQPIDTLFVFCDQALGPWVPLVCRRPHVVHAHDLLALRSALGEIPENPTSWTGKLYQRYIRQGFSKAKCFISISQKTQDDLHRVGHVAPNISEVVYNGLNYPYAPLDPNQARAILANAGLPVPSQGMLLHVSGGQWYKNQAGVIALYAAYAKNKSAPLELWCIGPQPNAAVQAAISNLPNGRIHFYQGLSNEALAAAYSLAHVFILPSLAEGFGWPIIEAQACGCPVLTTEAPPMTEVGASAARYLPLRRDSESLDTWASAGAVEIEKLLALQPDAKQKLAHMGIDNAARFNADTAIASYLRIYQQVLSATTHGESTA